MTINKQQSNSMKIIVVITLTINHMMRPTKYDANTKVTMNVQESKNIFITLSDSLYALLELTMNAAPGEWTNGTYGNPLPYVVLYFVPCIGKWKSMSSPKCWFTSMIPRCNDLVLLLPTKFIAAVSPCTHSLQQNLIAWLSTSGNIPTAVLSSCVVYGVSCHQFVVKTFWQLQVSEAKDNHWSKFKVILLNLTWVL